MSVSRSWLLWCSVRALPAVACLRGVVSCKWVGSLMVSVVVVVVVLSWVVMVVLRLVVVVVVSVSVVGLSMNVAC